MFICICYMLKAKEDRNIIETALTHKLPYSFAFLTERPEICVDLTERPEICVDLTESTEA